MEQISREELAQWEKDNRAFQLVDVREDYERRAYHIGGDWIPLGELSSRLHELATDCPIVFYCRKGVRSQIAIQRVTGRFPHQTLYNLIGGIGE